MRRVTRRNGFNVTWGVRVPLVSWCPESRANVRMRVWLTVRRPQGTL